MAMILQFPTRETPKPTVPAKITEGECRLLDKIKERADYMIDVVNAGEKLTREFLAGDKMLSTDFAHFGRKYRLSVSLEEVNDGPMIA